jgi:hypothetical protein
MKTFQAPMLPGTVEEMRDIAHTDWLALVHLIPAHRHAYKTIRERFLHGKQLNKLLIEWIAGNGHAHHEEGSYGLRWVLQTLVNTVLHERERHAYFMGLLELARNQVGHQPGFVTSALVSI